jgi:carbonic anhydrase
LLTNTGTGAFDTVRAEVPEGAAHVVLGGERWELSQFHWHTPSEHEVEGRDFPLELHLVHERADGLLLVLAVFMTRGWPNHALAAMFADLPEAGHTRSVPSVRLGGLLPQRRESFRYTGSRTTPPFAEPVQFVVFAEPVGLSERQIRAFQALFAHANSRELQPLGGREVLSDAEAV